MVNTIQRQEKEDKIRWGRPRSRPDGLGAASGERREKRRRQTPLPLHVALIDPVLTHIKVTYAWEFAVTLMGHVTRKAVVMLDLSEFYGCFNGYYTS